MTTITFDTQELVRELRSSGMPQEQSEAVVRAIVKSHSYLSTKADLTLMSEHFDTKLESMTKDMQTMELRLTVKLGAFFAAAVGILIAVLRVPH